MSLLKHNDFVEITLDVSEAPFRHFGKYKAENDEHYLIEGTHGDNTGKEVLVPKQKVNSVVIVERAGKGSQDRPLLIARFFRSDATSERLGEIEEHIVEAEWFQLTYETLRVAPDGLPVGLFNTLKDAWIVEGCEFSDIEIAASP